MPQGNDYKKPYPLQVTDNYPTGKDNGASSGSRWSHLSQVNTSGLSPTLSSPSSLVGSYMDSLLHQRLSASPFPSVTYNLQVSALGFSPCPASLRRIDPITIDFPATWYEIAGPYVASADLKRAERPTGSSEPTSIPSSLSLSDGAYRIAPRGQLSLIIKNQLGTAVKLFLIPYNLTNMTFGSKTFLRLRYVAPCSANSGKEVTRYAVHLTFVSPPRPTQEHPTSPYSEGMDLPPPRTSKRSKPEIYLYGSIRLVFPSRTPDSDEALNCIREEPGNHGEEKYMPWSLQATKALSSPPTPLRPQIMRRSLLGGEPFSPDTPTSPS